MQHSKRYLQTRKVARISFWLLSLALIYFLATHINYTADGFMFATLMGPNRAPFAGGDPMGGTAEETHRAMSTGLSYCGRWRMEGDRLFHNVELSMFPNWVGAEMTRTTRFDGDRAIVTTLPITDNGKTFVFELVLKRAA